MSQSSIFLNRFFWENNSHPSLFLQGKGKVLTWTEESAMKRTFQNKYFKMLPLLCMCVWWYAENYIICHLQKKSFKKLGNILLFCFKFSINSSVNFESSC